MPVDRSKELVWTEPISSSSGPSSPKKLKRTASASSEDSSDPNGRIPRPPNAFILFRSAFIKSHSIPSHIEPNHSTLSKIIGLTWRGLSEGEKGVWHGKAKEALTEHRRKWPGYAFRPAPSLSASSSTTAGAAAGGSGASVPVRKRAKRRRDEDRCQHIASLLITGVKGTELDSAIREFDDSRPQPTGPTIEFEEVMTESAFRTSSSGRVVRKKKSARREAEIEQVQEYDGMPELVDRPPEMDLPAPPTNNTFEFDSFSVAPPSTPITPMSFDAQQQQQHFVYPPAMEYAQQPYFSMTPTYPSNYSYQSQYDAPPIDFSSCAAQLNDYATPPSFPSYPDMGYPSYDSCGVNNSLPWPMPEFEFAGSTMNVNFNFSNTIPHPTTGMGAFDMSQYNHITPGY